MRPEDALQRVVVDFLHRFMPEPPKGPAWTAINPVTLKDVRIGRKCKELGAKAGWPDLLFVWETAFFIELKAPPIAGKRSGTLAKSQREQFPIIRKAGVNIYECNSLDAVVEALREQGVPLTGKVAA